MSKVVGLSSDVNFIKEFEELKLKQRLLIDSLKKKSQSEQERLFLEINAKLDFLVQIFKEANSTDDEKEKIDFEAKFNEVLDKINSLSTKVDESFSKIELLKTKTAIDKSSTNSPLKTSVENNSKDLGVPPISSKVSSNSLPPPPAFKTEISDKNKGALKGDSSAKKKKWF